MAGPGLLLKGVGMWLADVNMLLPLSLPEHSVRKGRQGALNFSLKTAIAHLLRFIPLLATRQPPGPATASTSMELHEASTHDVPGPQNRL